MPETPKTDIKSVIYRCQDGNKSAFRDIFELLHDAVFRYTLSRSSSREEALDITQDVFLDLWKSLQTFQYRSDKRFYAFVFTITKRRLIKYYQRSRPEYELDETRMLNFSYEIEFEDHRQLERWMKKLKPKYQELLRLRYWHDLPFSEIGKILKITEGTAKVWHHRALKKLKDISQTS